VPRAGSGLARAIFQAANWQQVVGRRRAIYARLLQAAQSLAWARPLFDSLPPGVCPLALPILAERRDAARLALLAAGINVRAYWEQLPAAVTADAYPDSHELSRRILVLPVHQSLTERQVSHMIRTLERIGLSL
jgi:dTDP-4-amino-4,6-dideoxygalactose transaminase